LLKIAVTGGQASGKSTFCTYLKECGATTVSADLIAHQLLSPDTSLGQRVINLLGSEIISNNKINRAKVANIVFKDPEKLNCLENILHPAVMQKIDESYQEAKKKEKSTLFAVEIPLLFEVGAEKSFDATVAIIADEKSRLKHSDMTPEQFYMRNQRMMSSEQKAKRADYVIINNGSQRDLKMAAIALYEKLTKRA